MTDTAVLLFSVCPLFSQEYTSIAYSQHYTDFVLFALSVYSLIQASFGISLKSKILWFVLSVISTVGHLSITEYFAFLELLKLPVLWFCLKNENRDDPFKTAFKWFIVPLIVFVIYCAVRYNLSSFFPQYNANTPEWIYMFFADPVRAAAAMIRNMAADLVYPFSGFISVLFDLDTTQILTGRELFLIITSLLLALLSVYFRSYGSELPALSVKGKPLFEIICFGLVGMILAILPFWIMNENYLRSGDPHHADRCFMACMPFFCLILSGILAVFFPDTASKRGAAAAAVFIFLFSHGQMEVNQKAADLTVRENNFYNQLAERIPGVMDGTAIVDDTIIFPVQGNFATASAINILYPNSVRENGDLPLWVFSYDTRLYHNHGGFHVQKRNYSFNQPPSDYIYIDHDNQFANCLWVFSPEDVDNPHVSDLQRGWIEKSNIGRINLNADITVNKEIFGENRSSWCSRYEKAALLHQKEDWESLSELAASVLAEGYTPFDNRSNSPFEWWPFIESLYRTGDVDTASKLAADAVEVDPAYKEFFEGRIKTLESQNNVR